VAGLASQLLSGTAATVVTLSTTANSRLRRRQMDILETMRHRVPHTRLVPVVLPAWIKQGRRAYNLNERSQRGRGFLFCLLGAAASLMANADELLIYENGIGAINLPLSEAQLGAQSSRATNPVALWKIERFLRSALELNFRLRLPFLFSTKGQICAQIRSTGYDDIALRSISCDGFPIRSLGPEQCGTCTSCLLRREALLAAGFSKDSSGLNYRHDVFGDLKTVPLLRVADLWDMLSQVDRLERALDSRLPWETLTIEFPELLEVRDVVANWLAPIQRSEIQRRLVTLYRDYCREWHHLPAYPAGWRFSLLELSLCA
jgi:hypothetical protein